MLSAARYSSKVSAREVHGPKGISFSRMTSGCMRSTRRTNLAQGRLSCVSSSGNWQMAMFMALPDPDPRPRIEIQLLPRCHVEGLVPGVEVADRRDAEAFRHVVGD